MRISFLASLITVTAIWLFFSAGRWQRQEAIQGDAFGYYAYLPALFAKQDLSFAWTAQLSEEDKRKYWVYPGKQGHYLPKMTIGLAYAWLPGYALVHAYYSLMGETATGWETGFHVAMGLTSCLFLLLGLSALLAFLKRRFSATASWLAVGLTVLATNLLYYTSFEPGMSHLYSFALFCLVLNSFDQWLIQHKHKYLVIASLLFGWLVLIRVTNLVFVLALFGLWFAHRRTVNWRSGLALLMALLPIIPQLLFWKFATGQWVYYSYGDERMFFNDPSIIKGLFSFRNGWFVYTPIAGLSIAGLVYYAFHNRTAKWWLAMLLVHIYVVFSWWCWYYGDSFSIRPMIDLYAILAIGLAVLIEKAFLKPKWMGLITLGLAGVLIANNLLQTNQYAHQLISGSAMTKQAFQALWLNLDPPQHLAEMGYYQDPDNDRLRLGLPERQRDTLLEWERSFNLHQEDGAFERVDAALKYSTTVRWPADSINTSGDRVLQVVYRIRSEDGWQGEPQLVLRFSNESLDFGYHTIELSKLNLGAGWQDVVFYIKKPADLPANAEVLTYAWFIEDKGVMDIENVNLRLLNCPYNEAL